MRVFKTAISYFLAAISVLSCGQLLNPEPEMFYVTPSSSDLTADQHTVTFDVGCDMEWDARMATGTWARISNISSIKTGTKGMVDVDVEMNGDEANRTDTLIITSGKKSRIAIPIRQQGIGSILSTDKVTITDKDGAFFYIKTKRPWTADLVDGVSDKTPTWFSITPSYGLGGDTQVLVSPREPNHNVGDRNAMIKITLGNMTRFVTVTQKQTDAILLTADKVELSNKESSFDVKLKTNISYDVVIDPLCSSWLRSSQTKAMNENTLTFVASANGTEDTRTGWIYFRGGGMEETVTVYQAEADILVLNGISGEIGSGGGNLNIYLKSNIEYDVTMDGNPTWIVPVETKAVRSDVRSFFVHANLAYDSRTATIRFKDRNSDLGQSFLLTQKQKNAILVDTTPQEISHRGGDFSLKVSSNVAYEVKYPEWVERVMTKGLTDMNYDFHVGANQSEETRKGDIIFSYETLADTISVTQGGKLFISAETEDGTVEFYGGESTVRINTNMSYRTVIPEDCTWIRLKDTGVNVSDSKVFVIDANTVSKERSAEITFIGEEDADAKASIVIKQKGRPADSFLDDEIPGIYGFFSRDWMFASGSSQIGIMDYGDHYSFRLMYTEENSAIEIPQLKRSYSLGESVNIRLLASTPERSMKEDKSATVLQISDDLVWMSTDDGIFLIIQRIEE